MADHVANCILQNASSVKEEEWPEDDFADDKVNVSETAIIIDKIKQYEVSTTLDNIKTDLSSSHVQYNMINDNVKIEEEIGVDIKIEFDNTLLYCTQCHEYYRDYCIKCGMLVHILNGYASSNADKEARKELPKDILEVQHFSGQCGVYALKVIPEGVKFGPFTGLNKSECSRKIRGGKFVSKHLNWMQYVNPAKNMIEQNLLVFQCGDNLYYQSTRQIPQGEELLVYFGDEYKDSLNKNVGVDFIANTEHVVKDVFACTFCCLGFSSKSYLAQHKAICLADAAAGFSIKELTQCPFCKIHLDQKEYLEHHMTYCFKRSARRCIPVITSNQTADVSGRKTRHRPMFICEQCNYRTKYNGDLKNHVNGHYEVKTCKCAICHRRFKAKESLRLHAENAHVYVEIKEEPEQSTNNYVNAPIKTEHPSAQVKTKQFKCSRCEFRTKHKNCLKIHVKTRHLMEFTFTCDKCEYKTNWKSRLDWHKKTKHLGQFDYKCNVCDYKTNNKQHLAGHVRTRHLKEFNYKCESCAFRTNRKSRLEIHIKTKHFKQFVYECDLCNYKTNNKQHLQIHKKTKHLKEFDYKCDSCEFRTNGKDRLESHIKTKHLIEFDYKCDLCDYKTNHKPDVKTHIKTKHLKVFDHTCDMCDYKTNSKRHIEKHLKTKHLKEFDYACDSCEFRTNYKDYLESHVKTKHLKEFKYKCGSCEFKTNRRVYLESHMKSKHLKAFDYTCDLCDYKTNHKPDMTIHIKTKHLKEFDYKCDVCDYKTNEKRYLERHLKSKHLNQFDYRCDICGYKTNHKQALQKHVRRRHPE